jgi:hypothetical protein
MSTSTLQELSNEVQVPRDFIEENIVPIVRVIYEQNSETNAFAGLVSLIRCEVRFSPLLKYNER